MKTSVVLVSLLFPVSCYGLEMPSINQIPLFYGMTMNNPMYREAAFAAQQAFFIQSGFTASIDRFTGFFSNQVSKVGMVVEAKVASSIDEHTPLNSKHVFAAAAICYTGFVKKEITQGFRNPVFHSVTHSITLAQDHQALSMTIPF